MKLIESKTLATAAASIEFTSIPQDGTDLVALMSIRVDAADTSRDMIVQFNGDTGNNYSFRRLVGTGSSASSSSGSGAGDLFIVGSHSANSATSNTFGNGSVYIPNYTGSTAKSASSDTVSENNATAAQQTISATLWSGTAAITSVLFKPYFSANLMVGSTISLYKITKGSDGIVTTS
jgi:hypothetical protein